jgi:SPP1 gp7 family putative phage head morphogenesis protein
MAADAQLKFWLKQHGRAEKALASDIEKFFRAQAKRITKALRDHSSLTDATVPQVLSVDDERKALWTVAEPHFVRQMATGASTQLAIAAKRKPKAKTKADPLASFDLPQDVKDAIVSATEELEGQGYWQDIQEATSERLTRLVKQGIEEGWNNYQLTKKINEALGGLAKSRAASIATTETTGAFNAGHQAVFESLGDEITGKIWLAVMDQHTRDSHAALNGKLVAVDGQFGSGLRFPGDCHAEPEDRVRCRCTVIAGFPE